MNRYAVEAIVRKDLKVVFQNKGVSIPLIVGPLLILVFILPGAAFLTPKLGNLDSADSFWLDSLIEILPSGIGETNDIAQVTMMLLLVYAAAAIFPLLPLLVVTAIASDSFAGEKERKTLEALLYTPTTDWELLVGKLLSAWLPALGITWIGFLIYSVMANLVAWPVMGRLFFPTLNWMILALWIAPAIAALGLGAMVVISSRARTFQEANQLAGVVVLPGFMLLGAMLFFVMNLDWWLASLLGLLVWAIDLAVIWLCRNSFRRNRLALQM